MKVLTEYAIGHHEPSWLMIDTDGIDVRNDLVEGLISRLRSAEKHKTNGWGELAQAKELMIRSRARVIQVYPEQL